MRPIWNHINNHIVWPTLFKVALFTFPMLPEILHEIVYFMLMLKVCGSTRIESVRLTWCPVCRLRLDAQHEEMCAKTYRSADRKPLRTGSPADHRLHCPIWQRFRSIAEWGHISAMECPGNSRVHLVISIWIFAVLKSCMHCMTQFAASSPPLVS